MSEAGEPSQTKVKEIPIDKSLPSNTAIYAAVVSTLAFFSSAVNVYYTNFRPADMRVKVGSVISIAYNLDENWYMSIPVVFANTGAKSSTVDRLEITLVDEKTRENNNFYAVQYQVIDDSQKKLGDFPSPEILTGGAKAQHQVLFLTIAGWSKTHRWTAETRYHGIVKAYIGESKVGVEVD